MYGHSDRLCTSFSAPRFRRLALTLLMFLASALLLQAPARAEVIEIADDGSVHVRSAQGRSDTELMLPQIPETAVTHVSSIAVPQRFASSLDQAARASGLSANLLAALVWQESGWRPDARSSRGAMGLTQLMPGTAADLGVDARDPRMNLIAGARYLRVLYDRFGGDLEKALAAYNAGPARVARARAVPALAETRGYLVAISHRLSVSALAGK